MLDSQVLVEPKQEFDSDNTFVGNNDACLPSCNKGLECLLKLLLVCLGCNIYIYINIGASIFTHTILVVPYLL